MAGVVPLPAKPSGRKQWTLHDGPRDSLRRLRSQLAEDGCSESQVLMAKQLLEETCELDADREENARMGVYWLIKASEQGNLEATDILKQCLETGQGINDHNYLDVKMCLSMSQDEKLARRAAREMFSSLAAGEDFITTDQLERRIRLVNRYTGAGSGLQRSLEGVNCRQSLRDKDESAEGWASRGEWAGEKLTEDQLVSAAATYARGELPVVHRALTLGEARQESFLRHRLASLRRLYAALVEAVARQATPLISSLFPIALSQVQMILLLVIYSLLGTDNLLLFVPMALYYASFCVMVVATFQMLQRGREFQDFRVWSQLFISYSGGSLNPEEAEYQYCSSNLRPYAHFFVALLTNLAVYPLIAPQWTPQSELTILAFFLTFLTLYVFMDHRRSPDLLALFSFAVHVLAKYPYETDTVVSQGWRFLDIHVPTFASYVVGHGVEFCLNFRAVFYLLIPAIFVKLASRDSWRGSYRTLIPHCVTLSWWQVAVLCSQGATWYGLVRSALAVVGCVLFLPLLGVATVALPVVALGKCLADSELALRLMSAVIAAATPLGLGWYLRRRRERGAAPCFLDQMLPIGQVLMALAGAACLLLPSLQEPQRSSPEQFLSLSWEQYQNHCHQPAWEETSVAVTQLQCWHLAGALVGWDGYVAAVRVYGVANPLEGLAGRLPSSVAEQLRCLYGEHYQEDCGVLQDPVERGRCRMLGELKLPRGRCHLEAWNRYEFEVEVKMKSGLWGAPATVVVIADDSFRNLTLALRPGDHIWFTGSLPTYGQGENLPGGVRPRIDAEEMACLGCHAGELQLHRREPTSWLALALSGVKSVLNFVFNPVVIFK